MAREALGFEELRAGQLEVVEAVLGGRDALAVMATGHGKSAIYQIAGLLLDGPTLVVSPLIALQRDQVEHLEGEALGGAAAVSLGGLVLRARGGARGRPRRRSSSSSS